MCLVCYCPQHSYPLLYKYACLSGPWRHLRLAQKTHRPSTRLSVFSPWDADHPSLSFILPLTRVNVRLLTVHQLGDSAATFYKCQQECLPLALQKALFEQNLFLEMQHSDFFSKSKVWISILFRSPGDMRAEEMHSSAKELDHSVLTDDTGHFARVRIITCDLPFLFRCLRSKCKKLMVLGQAFRPKEEQQDSFFSSGYYLPLVPILGKVTISVFPQKTWHM